MRLAYCVFLGIWLTPLASQAQQLAPPAVAPLSEDSVQVMSGLVQRSVRQLRGIYFEPNDARATHLITDALHDIPVLNKRLSRYTSSLSREQQQSLAQRLRQQPWQQELRALQQSPQFQEFDARAARTPALKEAATKLRAAGFLGSPPPSATASAAPATAPTAKPQPPTVAPTSAAKSPALPASIRHTVRKGETLFSIARRYAVTPTQLQAWNSKADAVVKIGEILLLNPMK